MKKILIVDDEAPAANCAKDFLEATGLYQVSVETDGRRALETAKLLRPDLVLLDVIMPFLDGTEVAGRFAKDPVCKNIPIIFLTSLLTPEEAAVYKGKIGGRSFIGKPVTPNELIKRVTQAFEKQKSA